MRLVLGLVLLLMPSLASADKDLQAVVKKNIVKLAQLADDPELGLLDSAIVIDQMGQLIDLGPEEACLTGAVANNFYGCNQASFTHKPGRIDVGADAARGIGWFQAPFTVISVGEDENGKTHRSTEQMRTGGVVLYTGKSWMIAGQMYTLLVPDKKLVADGKPAPAAPKLSGDGKIAKLVASWFSTGFAPAAANKGLLIASGTSAKEHATGNGAKKLVAAFDKLKLAPVAIDAKLLDGGKIAWVVADVVMPRKGSQKTVEMKLAVAVVPDGGSWRWVSLQYQYPWSPVGRQSR
jgi:hypothetical protein